ncbi:MAG: gephyrin-like molybdotransferase Glp [Bacteroidota bacterium]
MLSADRALEIIASSVSAGGMEVVELHEAHERVLAEEIIAAEDVPPFDNSGMDGYAVRAGDVAHSRAVLRLVGEVPAGQAAAGELGPGEAIRIMTGGRVPLGADAVVQIEWTESVDGTRVRVLNSVPSGHNIRRAGEDIRRGEKVFGKGRELRAAELGVLASLGKKTVEVYRVPRVAVLATGNELVDIDQPLTPGKIRNSNTYTLLALIRETSVLPVDLGIAADDRANLREKILQGLECDALVTTGGASVGNYDLVQEVLKEIGVEIKFWKVNIKPGMPLLYGLCMGKPVFGLPGNPVSTFVTFIKFVRPALRKIRGACSLEKGIRLQAQLEHEIKKSDRKRHFMRAVLDSNGRNLTVRTTGSQTSNVLTSLVKANCLMIIPEQVDFLKKGDLVEVELL